MDATDPIQHRLVRSPARRRVTAHPWVPERLLGDDVARRHGDRVEEAELRRTGALGLWLLSPTGRILRSMIEGDRTFDLGIHRRAAARLWSPAASAGTSRLREKHFFTRARALLRGEDAALKICPS